MKCPACETENADTSNFCSQCGQRLKKLTEPSKPPLEDERKYLTIVFSDLSGYTTLSEKLDPEELKEIMSRIFGEASQVIAKYEGLVEKFIGDAVMAIFGAPVAHEDDPVRAIKAAREIHAFVEKVGQEVKDRIGKQLLMHSGISTGLVVTGEGDYGESSERATGDTINVASRLTDLAKPGEILVGENTYKLSEHSFTFEQIEPTYVKGKKEPVELFKVLSEKKRPSTIHRLSGLRAEYIGRQEELAQLQEAAKHLQDGKSVINSICGEAGIGKSRLVEEFKATLDLATIQWREARSYAYSQNIPYFTLIDLLNRTWDVKESDSQDTVKEKIEANIKRLIGKTEDIAPYIGRLYGIDYPEIKNIDPEFWKNRLFEVIKELFSSLTKTFKVILFLEDIHWADNLSVELFHSLLTDLKHPAFFLITYRTPFKFFLPEGSPYKEIQLKKFTASYAQEMTESILKTKQVPSELTQFIQDKTEGNPFYLEEVINSLIESKTLVRDNGNWKITKTISEASVPLTINGVIADRVDRLEFEMKRILQEASVIGRIFFYEILKRITELKESIDKSLDNLEMADLIRKKAFQPDLEYIFKHALTQEVVYNGLLKKERHEIHERIAQVMEELFTNRLSEFYETLAFHYKQGKSIQKAVQYLMKSGRKNHKRYAVEEAYQDYKKAFNLLSNKPEKTKEEETLLIDLITGWAIVLFCQGKFAEKVSLLKAHEDLCKSLDDKERLGMLYAMLGLGLWEIDKFKDSHEYLSNALAIGEELKNDEIICYACMGLTFICVEIGLTDEAIQHGSRAYKISSQFDSYHFTSNFSLQGLGHAYHLRGDRKKCFEIAKALLDHGQKNSNIRSLVLGYYDLGFSYNTDGDYTSAIECFQKANQISKDPYYSNFTKALLAFSYINNKQFQEAEEHVKEVLSFTEQFGARLVETICKGLLGIVLVAKGQFSQGMRVLSDIKQRVIENGSMHRYALIENIFGNIYKTMAERSTPLSLSVIVNNIGFLLKNVPFAKKKAKAHFTNAIELSKKFGYKEVLGKSYLDLGLLYKSKGKIDKAKRCISEAIEVFEKCEIVTYQKQAREIQQSLK